ncbi:MAG: hypothetical protein KDK12_15635 [Rhodobacteraceae bacterium]|nr:hypothetical protein [Paracoccaceae bacterium]
MQTLIQARPLTLETGARLPLVLRLLNGLAAADARYRQKAALRGMPAERLADMGLTEADVARAFR